MASDFSQDPDAPLDLGGPQVPENLGKYVKWGLALVALILLFVLISFGRSVYTDVLWYDALGFRSVFVKALVAKIILFFIGSIAFGVLFGASIYVGNRMSRGPVTLPVPPEVIDLLRKATVWGSVVVGMVLSIIFGSILASRWEIFLKFTNSVSFGQTDPVCNRDISFYIFVLPVYTFLQGWVLGAGILILIGTLAIYFVNFNLRGVNFELTPSLKTHISIIGALILFLVGWGHWLDRWQLVLSDQGVVFGASYADLNARKPALLILTIIASASGVLMLVNAYLRGLRLFIGAIGLWIVLALALGAAWPAIMQQFTVTPNEFVKEDPYIRRNIEFTNLAFGLDRVEEQFYTAETAITAEIIADNEQTVNNIRLWDYRPLSDVYRQIQLIRPYYDFKDADVDRYYLDGQIRQVLLSAREIAPEKLDADSQTWVNLKLSYTHGIGIAMSPATGFTEEGMPEFYAKDIPSDGQIPISATGFEGEPEILIENPRIYYGENTHEFVIVNTNTDEVDYQTEDQGLIRTKYFGTGGVSLGSFVRRVAYAWQFADINILISGEITRDSLLQYRRTIQERVNILAPFLTLDVDPYIVAAEGQLFWMQDAYTTSELYPYSQPTGDFETDLFNYIRNSVKITIDAFNGTVKLYIWDPPDPIVQAYAKIFPDLFLPRSAMPASLVDHTRYPQDLFTIQAEKYIRYHQSDPQNFYANEDLWARPNEKFGQSEELRIVQPYYVIMRLPGEQEEEFVQLLPYTPHERQNLIGWLAARSDGENYGKLIAFNFPKDRQVDGPEQVEARIDADQDISAWFTLRCSEGSICIRGNLLVIPMGGTILYAEPVYIQAEGVRLPQLKRVILASGNKVVMEDTLELALEALTGFVSEEIVEDTGEIPLAPTPSATGVTPIQQELDTLTDAVEEIKTNISDFEDALERLRELAGGE